MDTGIKLDCIRALDWRLATLDYFAGKGLKIRLCPDAAVIQWRGEDALDDWGREHLRRFSAGFTEALRFRAGLCISCGMDAAKHPISQGRRQVFDPETKLAVLELTPKGEYVAKWEPSGPTDKIKDSILPALWCKSCWSRGAFEEFAFGIPRKAGPRADSKTRAAEDALFAAFDDEPEEQIVLF